MTSISTTTDASQSVFYPGVSDSPAATTSPSTRSLTNVGALAFVPPGEPGGSAALLRAFQAVAQKKGPAAAVQWILNAKTAGPLQAMISTGPGRMALAAAALGFTAGWAAGANAPRLQALATALKAVFDQHLPPAQAAQQVTQVLRAAAQSGKAATPVAPDRTAANRQVQPLATSLKDARANLEETRQLLKLRPGDQDLQIISKGQTAQVLNLQGKLEALRQGRTAQSTPSSTKLPAPKPVAESVRKPEVTPEVKAEQRPPRTLGELSPWLQDRVRKHNLLLTRALEIAGYGWLIGNNMSGEPFGTSKSSKSCTADVNMTNEHTVRNGKIVTDSEAFVQVDGSVGTKSVQIDAKASHPTTQKPLATLSSGEVLGTNWAIYLNSKMAGVYDVRNPIPSPRVKVKASCTFDDGTVLPAVVEQHAPSVTTRS